MKILIAEKDRVSRTILSQFLGQYGDCDFVVDGLEALYAFSVAMKDRAPYHLVYLDTIMPRADGVKTLKTIRDLENQYGVTSEGRAKVIMTTTPVKAPKTQAVSDNGSEAYTAKPIDPQKMRAVMEELGLNGQTSKGPYIIDNEKTARENNQTIKYGLCGNSCSSAGNHQGYFKSVRAYPDYRLEVLMRTGTTICFDFRSRMNTMRFGGLKDQELFCSVRTDGRYLIFEKVGKIPVKITASEFMDLVLIDRRKNLMYNEDV